MAFDEGAFPTTPAKPKPSARLGLPVGMDAVLDGAPAANPPQADWLNADSVMAMRVEGLGYIVLRTNADSSDAGVSIISEIQSVNGPA